MKQLFSIEKKHIWFSTNAWIAKDEEEEEKEKSMYKNVKYSFERKTNKNSNNKPNGFFHSLWVFEFNYYYLLLFGIFATFFCNWIFWYFAFVKRKFYTHISLKLVFYCMPTDIKRALKINHSKTLFWKQLFVFSHILCFIVLW